MTATTERVRPRPRVKTWVVVLWVVPSVVFLAFAALRLLGVTGNRFIIATMALTPYIGVVGLALGVIGLLMRRWIFGGIVLSIAMITSAAVVPRIVTNDQAKAYGPVLTVMTANLYVGRADASALVSMVQKYNVEVLSLQELSPAMVQDLDRAGIDRVLPYRLFEAEPGASGSGLASKYPLRQTQIADPATFAQPSAIIDLPGVVDPELMVVHTAPGVEPQWTATWRSELAELPSADFKERPRMLVGDFNATLDHPDLRDVISRGYADAAERRGAGMTPTWPAGIWPPPVAIDHVLVDARSEVVDYQVFDLPGSDHRAVLTQVNLP
ncbi:endonuclease/exonuclease/phosphatase (EEP) superfamily protein YafD [Kibdelosporangium banguiense]|uniref:Endonuclease/exonuclease/phosphatase (EEP) superfamily protein YafD n=1 Tax=Kibdelosporangium banguiense TaxID=1365924 RepID=A0ABS4TA75_9PSEU|nr:endonuclease/exonuclease/phosphatase family protein [Kibdelosporangium banguiense]MBP2321329.1 endonuclease/exonuclease/phosphatase (EEP) superfamily protein YafD [Kibdelosporangium banguiense]